jgi:hypothetical protein
MPVSKHMTIAQLRMSCIYAALYLKKQIDIRHIRYYQSDGG